MKVGFIGLGVQGKYLAINLADAGFDLIVFDLRDDLLRELASHGAKIARSNREVGEYADVVCVCVLDDAQVERVVLGPDGVLAGARSGALVVLHSTIEPKTVTRAAEAAAGKGVEVIDAPVSGSERGARNKTMSYMVGGSEAAFEKVKPLFRTSGENILHTGPVGTGIRAKIAHQLITCVNMMAAAEGMRLGLAAGLSAELLEKVMHAGAAQSRFADNWSKLQLKPHAVPVFYKDLKVVLALARELGVSVPGAALCQQLLDDVVP